MNNKSKKSITNDVFMRFLIAICYIFMIIALIVSVIVGITTQELISFLASIVILTMFGLLIIFFTIVLLAYNTELKREKEED